VSVPGATTTGATRINDLGQLIGTFSDGITSHAFLATPTGANAMLTSLLATLPLPALDASTFFVTAPDSTAPDSTDAGAGLLTSTGDNTGPNSQLVLLNNQGSFGS